VSIAHREHNGFHQEEEMPVKPIPEGYHSVQPYLMFKDSAAAIEFYKKAFNATERFRMNGPTGQIGHAEIQIGDSVLMMADESPAMDAWSIDHFQGSPVSFLVYVEDCDALYRQAVEAGGEGFREPADQPYGDRMSGVKDPFGYRWFLATHIRDVSPEAMSAQQA
jgi:PhnB protein